MQKASLFDHAFSALMASDPGEKCALTAALASAWSAGNLDASVDDVPVHPASLEPGRPERPMMVAPEGVPWRGVNSPEAAAALIHSLAHIEFNAINLALDAAYRFRRQSADYYAAWIEVAAEEAAHFQLLEARLAEKGFTYGDFPAHNGLWEMAVRTADDPLARMALVPRCMEARGLDAVPPILDKLRGAGDKASCRVLETILADEIRHVGQGDRWFRHFCAERGLPAEQTYRDLLIQRQAPWPRGRMNREARLQAGFSADELSVFEARAALPPGDEKQLRS